jgi:hypothetical protein
MPPFPCISYPPRSAMHPCIWWKITKFVVVVFWDLFPNTVVVTGSTQEVSCASRMIVATGSGSWTVQIPLNFTYYRGSWADYEPGILALRQRRAHPLGGRRACWPTCQGPRLRPSATILGHRSSTGDRQRPYRFNHFRSATTSFSTGRPTGRTRVGGEPVSSSGHVSFWSRPARAACAPTLKPFGGLRPGQSHVMLHRHRPRPTRKSDAALTPFLQPSTLNDVPAFRRV